MPLNPGTVLNNRYRTVKLLGQGGFGAVYRAWDLTLESQCALKENLETTAEAQRQFEREAKLLAHLSHPNLPRVTDHFVIPGQGQYLVMDFIEGEDLQDKLLQSSGMPEYVVIPWIIQICDALIYMHNQPQPIIHRDIKPANIKITHPDALHPQGKAVLVDFGIAKSFVPHTKTTAGARAVTPGYSPLEQYGTAVTDARTDIYSLAATLYALLTGQAPPLSTDRVMGVPLPSPRSLNIGVSPGIETVILKAMEVQPEYRYQTAIEFKAALTMAASVANQVYSSQANISTPYVSAGVPAAQPSSLPSFAPPGSRPPSQPPGVSSNLQGLQAGPGVPAQRPIPWKLIAGIGGGILLLICVIAAAIVIPGLLSGNPTPPVIYAVSTGVPTQVPTDPPTQVPTDAPTLAPTDAPTQAPTSAPTLAPTTAPTMAPATGNITLTYERAIQAHATRLTSLDFSLDGKILAVGSDDFTASLWDFPTGTNIMTLYGHTNVVLDVKISPDGLYLATASADNSVRIWRISDGRLMSTVRGHSGGVEAVNFSHDGSLMATGSQDHTVKLWRVSDFSLLNTFMGHSGSVWDVAFTLEDRYLVSADEYGAILQWDIQTGELFHSYTNYNGQIPSVSFPASGNMFVSGDYSGFLRLWNVDNGTLIKSFQAVTGGGIAAISPDSQLVAGCGGEWDYPHIWLWRIVDRSLIADLEARGGEACRDVSFSPDGTSLAAAFHDGTVRIWQLGP